MAAGNKFNKFTDDLAKKVHNLSTDTLKIMLTNTAPTAANAVKADIAEISAGNGYSAGGTALSGVSVTSSGGVDTLTASNVVFTASGGAMATWRYAVLYNSTPAAGPLIAWYDRGSSVTLNSGESETLSIATNILTLT